jgi:TIR domain-containing protein
MTALGESYSDALDSGSALGVARKRVFIVYAEYDEELAQTLKDLLDAWGFDASYCRQEIRELAAAEPYRKELADLLKSADLVLLILSKAFQHSNYCQAEAGATVIYEKRHIPITIPPLGWHNVTQASPVVEGWELVDGSRPHEFVRLLENKLVGEFAKDGLPEVQDLQNLDACKDAVRSALANLIDAYSAAPPTAALTGVWNKLTDPDTHRSILMHVRRAIEEGETNVAIAGVSLKYSIRIMTDAINALADNLDNPDNSRPLKGPLNIELFHVDDQSHILRSLEDSTDISSIVHYFRVGWPDTKAGWEAAGDRAGIQVNVPEPVAIDYIPQQVGVRIQSVTRQWSVLYAGACAFETIGGSTRLLVGEREYAFHTSALPNPYSSSVRNTRGPEAIEVFNQYVNFYSERKHNGAALVLGSEWILRLERCISEYQGIEELVLVSNTCQKLFPLIVPALSRGMKVKVYTTHPDLLPDVDKDKVRRLRQRLDADIAHRLRKRSSGVAELLYLRHIPTFRGVLIGDAVLGLEPYVVPPGSEHSARGQSLANETLVPSGLRLIVSKYGGAYERLREIIEGQCFGAAAEL